MIAYKERYDFSFAYLHFPYSPLNLAVFEYENEIVIKPIFDLQKSRQSPFFTFMGKVYETDEFVNRDDSFPTNLISDWVQQRVLQGHPPINLVMTKEEQAMLRKTLEREKARLEIKIEEIKEWLSGK